MTDEQMLAAEITPEPLYLARRRFLKWGAAAASMLATGVAYRRLNRVGAMSVDTDRIADYVPAAESSLKSGYRVDETKTPIEQVANYNNFYEFTTDKEAVSSVAKNFVSTPWQLTVDGMVHKPGTFDVRELMADFRLEERIYRMRCVEAWSMVIPWIGFPLAKLIERVEPMSTARFVAFESLNDPERMPGQRKAVLDWPYVEGLRLDEAMHPLTILALGLYGRILPPQNGAPIRLVVPWKYGFKGIKSIVRISVVAAQPPTTWNRQAPREYGFFANVNPEVPHPRWSQATEQRLGEAGRRATLPFNGYADQVAHLYQDLDLHVNF
ncbi:MAG: protein-methionine-sulfoxide reductase catalytic subunit MsrP [Planctomycetes bacterium]|nr:protein-methionine-sulfoxide reductase catalytic subunit MsrP [Planctomycetota bacterium]